MGEKILHLLHYKYTDIIKEIKEIKNSGWTVIQTAPPQESSKGYEWWRDYQPLSFKIGNRHGTKEELKELCVAANKIGIKIIVDVVLRHTATDFGALTPSIHVDKNIRENKKFFTNSDNITDYNDRNQTVKGSLGLPMLDYNNCDLQNIYIDFLQELKDMNVSGFRVDMAKHFSTPSEGSNFWSNVFGRFSEMFNYGECIGASRELLDQYTPYINTLGANHATDKSKSVVFFESHDTFLNENGETQRLNDTELIKGWKDITQENRESSQIFYARPYSNLWKCEAIKKINLL